ncbi:MAG: hypothetical protein KDJ17_02305 [Hyphomicrobiaceae bacterium]|nr:hypothetical protein [Hyphomicrobiaceae bacterium]
MPLRSRAFPDQTLFCLALVTLANCPRDGVRDFGLRLLARATHANT